MNLYISCTKTGTTGKQLNVDPEEDPWLSRHALQHGYRGNINMAAQYVTFLMYKLNEAKMPQTSFISDNLRIRGKFKATSSSRNDFIVMKTIFSPLLEFSFKSVMGHVFVVVNRQQVLFIILWKRM